MSRLSLNDVRTEALFASTIQPSDEPTAPQIRAAITRTVRQLGVTGCASRMAQEFGDSPHTAVARMRWARGVVCQVFALQQAQPSAMPQLADAGPLAA